MSEDTQEPSATSAVELESTGSPTMNSENANVSDKSDAEHADSACLVTSKSTSSTEVKVASTVNSTNSNKPAKTLPSAETKTTDAMTKVTANSQARSNSLTTQTKSTPSNANVSKKIVLKPKQSSSPATKSVTDAQFKTVLREMKELKSRLSKVELEVATLNELLTMQDDLTAEALSILPDDLKFVDTVDEEKTRWSKRVLPQNDYSRKESVPSTTPMMCNSHAWFGDAFLFEVMCQFKGYRPKQNNFFNSIYPYSTFDHFAKQIFSRKKFFRSCVIAIGYTDLFNTRPISGQRMKRTLHLLLNHMRAHGADRVKVLSIPPARQTMKNEEYLRICQTTNRFLKYVTQTHPSVDFINLDSLFINNYDDSFSYFSGGSVAVQISDNLLMRKEGNRFAICVEPETAKRLITYVSNYQGGSEISNDKRRLDEALSESMGTVPERYDDRKPVKRRMDTSHGSDYSYSKRIAASSNNEDRYEYFPSQSTHSSRRDSSRTNSSGRRTPVSRHRSPIIDSGRHRSPVHDSDRGDRFQSPERDQPYYRPSRDSGHSYDHISEKPPAAAIRRTIRNDPREQDSRHDRHQYSSSYSAEHDRSRDVFCSGSPARDYSDLRIRVTRSPQEKKSMNIRKSASPPPWLKKTHSSSGLGFH